MEKKIEEGQRYEAVYKMIFTYKNWDNVCAKLKDKDLISISAYEVAETHDKYIVLKHDVEADVPKAYRMAQIEHKYGHRGSYYIQAYLLGNAKNKRFLKEIQKMGHEVSYHYDVMDFCKGDIDKAINEFDKNKTAFESDGFQLRTVCQHGNPVVERIGYASNRDFFRSAKVQDRYPDISDIMVDFKKKYETEYNYYSDSAYNFKQIYDPINNDRIYSDDKNLQYKDFNDLFDAIIASKQSCIISTHPHRWASSVISYLVKAGTFKCIKTAAKYAMKISGIKKIMSQFYYLAKKL